MGQVLAQAPRWIMGLLIVLLGVRAALLVADLAGPPALAMRPVTSSGPAASRRVVDIPSILRANLFGQSALPTGTDAPVTTMNLKLPLVLPAIKRDGTIDEKLGWAAIGSGDDTRVYKVGDPVPGGAVLHAVYADRVLLDRGGSIEALLLPQREGAGQAVTNLPPVASSGPSTVERVQQVIRENPSLINEVMQRQAVFENGRLIGVRVNPGPNAQAFARLGLRSNDIVTAINGTPLDDQSRANDIMSTLNSAAQARVTVTRNGREQDINLNLAEIANEAEQLADSPQSEEPDPGPDDSTR
jgi:general secretion pathway protein C